MKHFHVCEEGKDLEPSYIGTEILTHNVELFDEEKNAYFSNSDDQLTSIICEHCGMDILNAIDDAGWILSFN